MKEEEYLIKRLKELADNAWKKNIYTNTNFLNMAELSLFYREAPSICAVKNFYRVWGGTQYCERCVIMFGNEEEFGFDIPFPIACIHVKPVQKKFADSLSHRDFLGALINLGIKREMLGDIIIKNNEAFVFCMDDMAEYIIGSLDRVKHTIVKCSQTVEIPDIWKDNIKKSSVNVVSLRLDAMVAEVYKMSRSMAQGLIREKKVFVNGRLNENNSGNIKEEDVISVRGYGRFIFKSVNYTSKKGRLNVAVEIFG